MICALDSRERVLGISGRRKVTCQKGIHLKELERSGREVSDRMFQGVTLGINEDIPDTFIRDADIGRVLIFHRQYVAET